MTERQLKKTAKHYAARLPDEVSYHAVKYDFEHCGWRFVLFNTENGDRLLGQISADLLQYAKTTKGFVYVGTTARYIGIDAQLSEEERLLVMVHEAAHIELGHKLILEYDEQAEAEASRFVAHVLKCKPFPWQKHLKKMVICACCLAVLLVGGAVYLGVHSVHRPSDAIPATAPASQTEEDPFVYYTSGGEKYHKKECPIIKYKTNVTAIKLSEAIKRFEPCEFCFSDAQPESN